MKKPTVICVALTVTLALSAATLAPAESPASSASADGVMELLSKVPTEIPVLQGVGAAAEPGAGAPGTSSSDSAALHEATDVAVTNGGEDPLAVDLVAAQNAVEVSVSSAGIEVIDNGDGSRTIPLSRSDGSLQVVTVIETPSAPRAYSVGIDLPAGTALSDAENGALLAIAPDGTMALGVAPAWAYDAAGVAVPTRYEVTGSVITQVVEHDSGEYQYPITADPWLGQRLFSPMTVNRKGAFQGRAVYSGRLTAWGVAMGAGNLGYTIMSTAGWEEFASSWSAVRNSRSMYQQYQCHALWGRAIIGAGIHWDLEAVRPANTNWADVLNHKCNW